MRSASVFLPLALGVSVFASACSKNLVGQDAAQAGADGDAHSDAQAESNADHTPACYPLFHACTTTDECCAPNRCLNITGTLACQQEGPAMDAAGSDGGNGCPPQPNSTAFCTPVGQRCDYTTVTCTCVHPATQNTNYWECA